MLNNNPYRYLLLVWSFQQSIYNVHLHAVLSAKHAACNLVVSMAAEQAVLMDKFYVLVEMINMKVNSQMK